VPFIDQEWEGGGHIARKYYVSGLDFLLYQPVRVAGDSDSFINYYAPHIERDLQIVYDRAIPFPIEVTKLIDG